MLIQPIGSPHARGDGPKAKSEAASPSRFSPRAWGWSDIQYVLRCHNIVLPTRVGMVRPTPPHSSPHNGSPHARGDGPQSPARATTCGAFSPRAWGWSDPAYGWSGIAPVLPTRVGMVRHCSTLRPRPFGSPHARGDGPPAGAPGPPSSEFSPRAWGWSVRRRQIAYCEGVLPTRVGMVRTLPFPRNSSPRSPHARGDGPSANACLIAPVLFSPRAWGWSGYRTIGVDPGDVLPTRVGMVRCG